MARIEVEGIGIDYRLVGREGAPLVVLTPGGRFSKDSPGVPELADALAAGGLRVLLWDRPNCGASDLCFAGPNESELHARVLVQLVRALGFSRAALAGGSAGSRVSLIAAARAPELVSHLVVWWVSGGTLSLISLAYYYCVEHALAASRGGMEAVAALPLWREQLTRNPRNRELLLSLDPREFIRTMERWARFYLPVSDSPVPGLGPADFARLVMPVRIYRNGKSDLSHPPETTDWLSRLIPHAELVDPPWPDDEWNRRSEYAARHGSGHFAGWPALAEGILAFIGR
ncbi:MAG: alpha/beta hydrolase [Porticoccaceae bacterium]|nr:MAG: alpha/beta hydrolase [Porticoccaceae bacterium]